MYKVKKIALHLYNIFFDEITTMVLLFFCFLSRISLLFFPLKKIIKSIGYSFLKTEFYIGNSNKITFNTINFGDNEKVRILINSIKNQLK